MNLIFKLKDNLSNSLYYTARNYTTNHNIIIFVNLAPSYLQV